MLYIIRHGETELNSKHVLQGRSDNELDSKGFDQSRKASEWLKKEGIGRRMSGTVRFTELNALMDSLEFRRVCSECGRDISHG